MQNQRPSSVQKIQEEQKISELIDISEPTYSLFPSPSQFLQFFECRALEGGDEKLDVPPTVASSTGFLSSIPHRRAAAAPCRPRWSSCPRRPPRKRPWTPRRTSIAFHYGCLLPSNMSLRAAKFNEIAHRFGGPTRCEGGR